MARKPPYRGEVIEDVVRLAVRRKLFFKVLRERSLVEGLWNGRRGWLGVAALVWGLHGINKSRHREESVLLREVLKPGEHVIIRQAITRPTRRQQRKAGKTAAAGPTA